jgi:hypothetical protein
MKHLGVVLCFGLILAFTCPSARAIEYFYNDVVAPTPYVFELPPTLIQHGSQIDIYVKNNLDPVRWKDWIFKIWVPVGDPDLLTMQVDYSNDPPHLQEQRFDVPLAPVTEPFLPGWKGFYADTFLVGSQWEQFGTSPVGSGGQFPIGNPAWVSFHFDVGVDPWIYIKDACIPEPATVALLGLGAMALLRKRS